MTPDVPAKLSADAQIIEDRAIRAKAIRHGVDEKWVRERMILHKDVHGEYAKKL